MPKSAPTPNASVWGPLVALVALPALMLGAMRPEWVAATAALTVGCAAFAWRTARNAARPVHLSPFALTGALLTGWALFQLVPLPAALLTVFNFENAAAREALAVTLSDLPPGGPITLAPAQTSLAVARTAALALTSLALATLLPALFARRAIRPKHLAHGLAVAFTALGVVQVAVGLAQSVLGDGTHLLGFVQTSNLRLAIVNGTFVNPNHAGALMAMSAVMALGLTLEAKTPARRGVALGATVLIALGVLLSGSRGALGSLVIGLLGYTLHASWRAKRPTTAQTVRRSEATASPSSPFRFAPWALLSVLGTTAAAALIVSSGWQRRVFNELAQHRSLDALATRSKLRIIQIAADMLDNFAIGGIGADAFGYVASAFIPRAPLARFSFVECDPIELLLAYGLPIGGAALLGLALGVYQGLTPAAADIARARRRHPASPTALAAVYALVAMATSALVSFNLEALGLALPALVLAESLRAYQRRPGLITLSARPAAVAAASLTAACALGLGLYAYHAPRQAPPSARPSAAPSLQAATEAAHDTLTRVPMDGHATGQAALAIFMSAPDNPDARARAHALAARAVTLTEASPAAHIVLARTETDPERAATAWRSALTLLRPPPKALLVALLDSLPTARQRALALPPRNAALIPIQRALLARKQRGAWLELAVELQSLHTDQPDPYIFAMRAALANAQPTLAELYGQQMLATFPDDPRAYATTARALLAQDRPRAALALLTRGLARLPDNTSLRLQRCATLLDAPPQARPDDALQLAKADLQHARAASLAKAPTRVRYHQLSAKLWDQLGDPKRAAQARQRAASTAP